VQQQVQSVQHPAEEELRLRLVEGDETALAGLYDRFRPMVYGLAARVTGDWSAAEDVVQEVFAEMWLRPEAFDPRRGSLRTWLGTLTHRRSVDWVRREEARRRRQRVAVPDPRGSADLEDRAVASAVAERVRVAVAALPAAQRLAIQLAYFEGRTYRQVAEVLGVPEGTAKSRLRLGLQRLALLLEAEGITSCP
jgi:RNA polymerase sigma factor (sigma-70 family)